MNKKTKIIIISIAIVLASAAVGYGALWLFTKGKQEQPEETQAPQVVLNEVRSAEEIIASATAESLELSEGAAIEEGYMGNKQATYTSLAGDYRIVVPTLHGTQVVQSAGNTQDIHQKFVDLLEKEGLTQTNATNTTETAFTYFNSQNVICEAATYHLDETSYHLLNCAAKSQGETMARQINELLDLTNSRQHITRSIPTFIHYESSEDNKSLVRLTYSDDRPYELYFASIDDKWEYLGQREIFSDEEVVPASPNELKKKLDERQEAYGDFLTRRIILN